MSVRVVLLVSLASVGIIAAPLRAVVIPCNSHASTECTTDPTCTADGFCRGEPTREGLPCTENLSGACMTNPVCQHGVCMGTVAAPENTPCFYPGFEKCYSPGHCMVVPVVNIGVCVPGTPKQCPPTNDPCKVPFCNPLDGSCGVTDKCLTFYGCETCNAGVCQVANLGQPCTNPDGDFNDCTTDDRCTAQAASSVAELGLPENTHLPAGVAAALSDVQQAAETRGICKGVPVTGPIPTATPTVTAATPTPETTACLGDCDGDSNVRINELITIVNIAHGDGAASCPSGGVSGGAAITDVMGAISHALNGCG